MRKKPEHEQILDRFAALAAIMAVASFDYGPRILVFCTLAAAVSMLTELICLYLRHERFGFRHLDAAVCGILIYMLMPPTVSVSLLILSCVFAIIIGRQVFGGRKQMLFPTAAVGYCFGLMQSGVQMRLFPLSKGILPLYFADSVEQGAGLSEKWNSSGHFPSDFMEWLTGPAGLPTGSVSVLLLLVIAAVLCFRRSASLSVLLPMLTVICGGNVMLHLFRAPLLVCTASMMTNQTLFSAVFLYADPMYAPKSLYGFLYGLLCGILVLIMTFFFAVTDAPVMISVLVAPLALYLHRPELFEQTKGGVCPDETEGDSVPAAELSAD